jgi:hypothetical protein
MEPMLNSLTEAELAIVRSSEPKALVDLDEDALLELHDRVRRARNRYRGQYRRRAAANVLEVGGRGRAHAQNQRARDKVEVFETALARVSTALAKAARRAAAELKSERLAMARSAVGVRPTTRPPVPAATADTSAAPRPPLKSTGRRKRDASDIAIGRRNQAGRDSRARGSGSSTAPGRR